MKYQKSERCPSQVPRAQCDIFNLFFFCQSTLKPQRCSVYSEINKAFKIFKRMKPANMWHFRIINYLIYEWKELFIICLQQLQSNTSSPLEGRPVLLFLLFLLLSPPCQPEELHALPYLIIYYTYSSIIHTGSTPVIQRSHYTTISHPTIYNT